MGVYIYKVTRKVGLDSKGRPANLAVYAYKPFYWAYYDRFTGKTGEDLNRTMEWKSKCYIAEKYVRDSKNFTGRVMLEDGGDSVKCRTGTFTDAWFDARLAGEKEVASELA